MRKLLWYIIPIGLLFALPTFASSSTLYQYYQSALGHFPPIAARQKDAASCGIKSYVGTKGQNAVLAKCLGKKTDANPGNLLLGVAPPDLLNKTIRTDITAGTNVSTFNVDPLVTNLGRRLVQTDIGDRMFFRIGSGSNVDWGYCDAMVDNTTYYTLNSCTLGLNDYGTSLATSTANIHSHSAGEPFIITNSHHWFIYYFLDTKSTSTPQTIAGDIQFTTSTIYIGNNTTAKNKNIYAYNGTATFPFLRYNEATGKWLFSNDGVSTYDPSAGGSGLSAGNGIVFSSSFINFSPNATSTSGLGFSGATVIVVTSTNGGITANADGLVLNTSSSIRWQGPWTFSTVTSTFSTTTIGVFDTVSTTSSTIRTLNVNTANIQGGTLNGLNINTLATNSTTPAAEYHYHPMTCEIDSYSYGSGDVVAAGANVSFSHTLGVRPSYVDFTTMASMPTGDAWSQGTWTSSTNFTSQFTSYSNNAQAAADNAVSATVIRIINSDNTVESSATMNTPTNTTQINLTVGTNVNTAPNAARRFIAKICK